MRHAAFVGFCVIGVVACGEDRSDEVFQGGDLGVQGDAGEDGTGLDGVDAGETNEPVEGSEASTEVPDTTDATDREFFEVLDFRDTGTPGLDEATAFVDLDNPPDAESDSGFDAEGVLADVPPEDAWTPPPTPVSLTLDFPDGLVHSWGSEVTYRAFVIFSDGTKQQVVFPDLSVETTYEHVLWVDEKGRIFGVGPGTGMIFVAYDTGAEVFRAKGKVFIHDFSADPPKGDTCSEAVDATKGLWLPVYLGVAWDDGDPPAGCESPKVPHSGPEVHLRLSPEVPTRYRVFVHPAAALDPMISVVDHCGDFALCVAAAHETGQGEDEELILLVPGGEERIVIIEGEHGEAGWFNVTVQVEPEAP